MVPFFQRRRTWGPALPLIPSSDGSRRRSQTPRRLVCWPKRDLGITCHRLPFLPKTRCLLVWRESLPQTANLAWTCTTSLTLTMTRTKSESMQIAAATATPDLSHQTIIFSRPWMRLGKNSTRPVQFRTTTLPPCRQPIGLIRCRRNQIRMLSCKKASAIRDIPYHLRPPLP